MRYWIFAGLAIVLALGLACGDDSPTDPGGEQNPTVTIYNDLGSWTIYYIYCSPSDESSWGDDWLGSEVLLPDEEFSFEVSDEGDYDIKLVDEDGDTYTRWGVTIDSDGYYWAVTLDDMDPSGAPVTVYNGLDDTIYYLYCTLTTDPYWGDDWLGSEVLLPGEQFTFYVEPGDYDIRAVDENSYTYTAWGVEIDTNGVYWIVTEEFMD